jgi:organic hydroperoxide reductase OsmC/OhrA
MHAKHQYSLKTVWTGASQGPTGDYESYSRAYRVGIPGKPDLTGSADPAFRGDPTAHNPEDLLVAALSACHMLSYLALCARSRIMVIAYEDDASGEMVVERGGGHFTEVVLRPRVVVAEAGMVERAKDLHDLAHKQCFIGGSVNFPVRHEPVVTANT